MPVAPRDSGRGSAAYDAVRREILSGRLEPGARLKPSDLATRFDLSAPVIREALVRLAGERLVQGRPNRGFSVVSLSRNELEQHTEARILVDVAAVRLATERGDLQWESQVVGEFHRLSSTPVMAQDDPTRISDEWASVHASFHRAIIAGCQNHFLLDLRDQLAGTADMLIRWAVVGTPERRSDSGHEAITNAVLARDADLAADLLAAHYRRTAEQLLPRLPAD